MGSAPMCVFVAYEFGTTGPRPPGRTCLDHHFDLAVVIAVVIVLVVVLVIAVVIVVVIVLVIAVVVVLVVVLVVVVIALGNHTWPLMPLRSQTGRLQQRLRADEDVVNCPEPHPHLPTVMATSGIDYDIKIWAPTSTNDGLPSDR